MVAHTLRTMFQWCLAAFIAFAFWHVTANLYDAIHRDGNPFNVVSHYVAGELKH